MDFLSSQKHTVLMASWGPGVVSLGDGGVRHDLPVNRWAARNVVTALEKRVALARY
ncbi:MAG: hypothetical protein KAT75_00810 [Dehalococcoidia bacterium]|nr:hypothetical protein [Dehalococcoidia bacterium]